ncbi:MAG TPA: hypothetical protein PLU30_07130 [Verrucomicrobiae bacterium]|nr:hypothetical protein [Verrucomicrobiae bacterium]
MAKRLVGSVGTKPPRNSSMLRRPSPSKSPFAACAGDCSQAPVGLSPDKEKSFFPNPKIWRQTADLPLVREAASAIMQGDVLGEATFHRFIDTHGCPRPDPAAIVAIAPQSRDPAAAEPDGAIQEGLAGHRNHR